MLTRKNSTIFGYTSVNKYRKDKKGGGASLHVLQGITFTLWNDLDYFDSEMETVFYWTW